jgi:predicted enzyme related to lactoylglutathione lyase
MAKIIGLGVFITASKNSELIEWYRNVLGLDMDTDWGGVGFEPEIMAKTPNATQVFSIMSADTTYFEPSKKPFMLNFCVDDMDGFLIRLKEHNIAIGWQDHANPHGRFVHILDPEGHKVELWEPKKPEKTIN